jgi:tRNA threonylcarbamoyl adenosine modification protein YjeE
MMASPPPGATTITINLPNEQAMRDFAVDLANALDPGDVVTLSGDLGAGKTTLARAIIRHLAGDQSLDVPSPTFTLLQTYELPHFVLAHADFYRLKGPEELAEIGFEDLPVGTVVLLEWPDRAPDVLPPDRFDVEIRLDPSRGLDYRSLQLTGFKSFATRAERVPKAREFLEEAGFGAAVRERLAGDASTRSYERLTLGERTVMFMNAPRRPDGPPVRYGRPYSAIAHLAEDVRPFVAMANGLRERGFSAPELYATDIENGFVVLEDLGDRGVVEGDPPAPIAERYRTAVDLLIALHSLKLPGELPLAPSARPYRLPSYDAEALMIEIELLLDWYLPRLAAPPTTTARNAFLSFWRHAIEPVLAAPKTWVLRDFHSPNLLWLPEREGIARVGLLDFQDAMLGSAAYDVASLLQDARVDVPEALEIELFGRYARARREADPRFDVTSFAQLYATLAAQRASKILGIFARLDRRDRKPQYLRHMPRVATYLQRALAHPSLAPLKAWCNAYVPLPPPG